MRRILIVAFLVLSVHAIYAQQQNCAQTLRLARSTYDQGRLHELPSLMKECLKPDGFNKQERVEAYKLLTMGYIYLEEPEKADSSMLLLLKTDPYFLPNDKVDPQEFLGLWKTFRTWPIYRLGVKIGANASKPNVISSNNASQGTTSFNTGLGFLAGFSFELPIRKKLTFAPDLLLSIQSFNGSSKTILANGTEFNTNITQSLSYVSLPIKLQYQPITHNLNPFVSIGTSFDYLASSTLTLDESRTCFQSIAPQDYNLTSFHNKFNLSALIGAGIKKRIGGGIYLLKFNTNMDFRQFL